MYKAARIYNTNIDCDDVFIMLSFGFYRPGFMYEGVH